MRQVIGKRARRGLWAALAAGLAMSAAVPVLAAASASDQGRLAFDIVEGRNLNSFLRDGPVAAHMLLRSGRDPRILVAFPAGNSGVGLWFEPTSAPVSWRLTSEPKPTVLKDEKGRPLYGIETTAEAKAAELTPKQAVLSSVGALRDYQTISEVLTSPKVEGDEIVWSRDRLDGAAGYRLSLAVTDGAISGGRLVAGKDGVIRLRITALSGERPLTPLGGDQLLNAQARADPRARNALNFLSYKEKFLAGSWRFDSYFGRDTLMSMRLLMPALQPEAVDGGLRAVLARLSPQGEVAHEEAVGEMAVLDHLKAGEPASDVPIFDYIMIDSSYMLAPVAAAWLVDDPRGRSQAAAFLASPSGGAGDAQETSGAALVRNLRLVLQQTRPFADQPTAQHLLEIKPGRTTGQWRDSGTGLGNGRYPYDVNAVFAPAALSAISRMYAAGLLDPYLTPADREAFAGAGGLAETWRASAPHFFEVEVPGREARRDVAAYAKAQGVPDAAALKGLGTRPLEFHALALNADGSPVRVVNSDEGFELLFGAPDPATLSWEVAALMRPFPAGLMTPVGLLVANPAYADAQEKALFPRTAYHGEVVWSWQQALLAAGLERQLKRTDLPAPVRAELEEAQKTLWAAIERDKAVANSELWSWAYGKGGYRIVPFGAGKGDVDESNAAQLWSTVFLALRPPAAR